jgi:GTP cyclohydrolase I
MTTPNPEANKPVIDQYRTRIDEATAQQAITTLLEWIGENPAREGLQETPKRVTAAFRHFFQGYQQDPIAVLQKTFTEVSGYQDMVIVKKIHFVSHCEHHMLPIIGHADIAYIPHGKIVGLSKLARVTDILAKRLQTQEALTAQIAGAINQALNPRGVAVRIEATHQCMQIRGVEKINSATVTQTLLGDYQHNPDIRKQFYDNI